MSFRRINFRFFFWHIFTLCFEYYRSGSSNSVNDNPQNQFKVFPNPANNTVLIERVGVEAADLRILDITGRICLSQPIQYGETQIRLDVSKLTAGKYIIEINNETGSLIVE